MKKKAVTQLPTSCFKNPLLQKLSDLATNISGIGFIIIFPNNGGWDWAIPSHDLELPKFCRMIHATKEGAKHCKMCHILMAIAACSEGLTEQRCHAHASVLVAPVRGKDDDGMAVIGTCTYAPGDDTKIWRDLHDRGRKLGIDTKELGEAYRELPRLSPENLDIARAIMSIAGEAIEEIRARCIAEDELKSLRAGYKKDASDIVDAVEWELKKPALAPLREKMSGSDRKEKKGSALVKIVSDLVTRKPNLPFSVAEIAAAARITPNHFSTLFRLHTGLSFTDFITGRRVEAAKKLLGDLTLNIGEVALSVGYSDAGYFTRRFKQKTGVTPREWRAALRVK
jgi:AraC-like DNA-binding protein